MAAIRIVSDGTARGTKVYDGDEDITNSVRSIKWEIGVDQPLAQISVEMLPLIDVDLMGMIDSG